MNRRLLAAAACLALMATPAFAAKHKSKGFTPKKVAAVWSGTWSNHTFNTSGPITLRGKLFRKGKAFKFDVDLGGNALGCPDPPAQHTPTITKGSGKNHWNSKGFRLHLISPSYGTFTVTYVDKTHKLTGSGGNPSCAPNVTWSLDGTLTHSAFTGSVTIDLGNGQTASSSLTANRQ
ncbi:MAG TPA: hypothetical protein VF032_01985 [Thermoleophilaceae bacterium]